MKTIILYYSYTGNTRALAKKTAAELGVEVEEIFEVKKPFMLVGILRAFKRGKTEIQPLKSVLQAYEKIIIMSPVWGSFPVSAINTAIDCLPAGKQVEMIMVSAGGGTKKSAEGTKALITARGCEITCYRDVKVRRDGDAVYSEDL